MTKDKQSATANEWSKWIEFKWTLICILVFIISPILFIYGYVGCLFADVLDMNGFCIMLLR